MRIKLKELSFDFTNDEIIDFLIKNDYKIEEHKVKSFLDDKYFDIKLFAVPVDNEYNPETDHTIHYTFNMLIPAKKKLSFRLNINKMYNFCNIFKRVAYNK